MSNLEQAALAGAGDHAAAAPSGVSSSTALLEIQRLEKTFGTARVLAGIDFSLKRGETVCIVGPSGSGKTTLIRCMNLLIEPTAGKLFFRGRLIGDWPEAPPTIDLRRHRREIGMVFQHFELFPHLTALDNITLAPRWVLGRRRSETRAAARELLGRIGLEHLADAHPHRLSGGQKQRIAIARALAMSPELILFDEPTSALDPEMVGEVLRLMADLARDGVTMVIVTHELGFAQRIADRLVVMEAGTIVEQGPTAAMFEAPQMQRTREILQLESSWEYEA